MKTRKLTVEIPQEHAEALIEFAAARGGRAEPYTQETVITPDGVEIYLYDLERVYSGFLDRMPMVDELLAAGWILKPWDEVDEDEAARLGEHINFHAETDLYLSPDWHTPPQTVDEIKELLDDFLIPANEET